MCRIEFAWVAVWFLVRLPSLLDTVLVQTAAWLGVILPVMV